MDPIRERLQELDQKADQLQKQGKYAESLDILEEMLNVKRQAYGEESEEYFKTSEKLCELCNLIAMICLQKEKFEASLDFLKKAEILSQSSLHYKAVTYNNLACYYRRTNKLRIAEKYLQQALDIEIKMENPQSLADTHLNMCAVLSQLSRHDEALQHVLLSIVMLQDEFMENSNNKPNQQQQPTNNNNSQIQNSREDKKEEGTSQPENKKNPREDRIAVLAIAYHNMGVELEYLKRYDEAIQTYNKAVKFSIKNLGPQHQLVDNLQNVLKQAQSQIESQRIKELKRKEQKYQNQKSKNVQQITKLSGLYSSPKDQKRGQTAPYYKQMGPNQQNMYANTQTGFNPAKKNSQGQLYPRSPQGNQQINKVYKTAQGQMYQQQKTNNEDNQQQQMQQQHDLQDSNFDNENNNEPNNNHNINNNKIMDTQSINQVNNNFQDNNINTLNNNNHNNSLDQQQQQQQQQLQQQQQQQQPDDHTSPQQNQIDQ